MRVSQKIYILNAFSVVHSAVCWTFTNNINVSEGPDLWKFDNSLISDTTFIEQMKSFIQKMIAYLVKDNSLSDQNKREYLK